MTIEMMTHYISSEDLYWPKQLNMSSEDWYWPEQFNISSEDLYWPEQSNMSSKTSIDLNSLTSSLH
jgi:hypothetical protein